MKFLSDEVFVIGVVVLVVAFFLALGHLSLEEWRIRCLTEAAAKGADPVALSCAMGKQEACAAWAKREGK